MRTSRNRRNSIGSGFTTATLLLGASLSLSTTASAHPEEGLPGSFTANIALTTNYIYRGITQSDDGPALSGGFDYAVDLFYAGVWASSVEWDGTSIEVDYYAGLTPSVGDFNFDIGFLYYSYPDSPDLPEQDFYEIYGGVSTTLQDTVEVGVKLSFSPDFYGETGEAYYPEVSLSVPVGDSFSIDAAYAQQIFEDDLVDDYSTWSIGATFSYEGFDFTLTYSDTVDRIGGEEDDAIVFSISRSF